MESERAEPEVRGGKGWGGLEAWGHILGVLNRVKNPSSWSPELGSLVASVEAGRNSRS